jgi:hypothetical protein
LLFGPWGISFGSTTALAAGLIVVLICCLFNRLPSDVGVGPLVQLMPVEGDTLFSNGKFSDVRAYFRVKYSAAHAKVRRGLLSSDEAGEEC